MNLKKLSFLVGLSFFNLITILSLISSVSANGYFADVSISLPDGVFFTNENITLKGKIIQSNYSSNGTLVSSNVIATSQNVNVTIVNKNGTFYANYSMVTDSSGYFYSRSSYSSSSVLVNAPLSTGYYYLTAAYTDPNSTRWVSSVEFQVVNQSVDSLRISTEKATYTSGDTVVIQVEAVRVVGDNTLYVSNVTINGSVRNSTLSQIGSNFSCTTGSNGKCTVSVSAQSTSGKYIVELGNFKSFGSFYVVPYNYAIYMKDELGKSVKNVFAIAEQGSVEVNVVNTSFTSDVYNFSGYIVDSSGNVVKTINSTSLNSNNSFTNTFTFTFDALTFSYGAYRAIISLQKEGGSVITSYAVFEVKDWVLSINKRSTSSGFEYDFSAFPNKTLYFEVYPTYRTNGSVIPGINETFFSVSLKDGLNNLVDSRNVSWNSTCAKAGCYEFYINASSLPGKYTLYTSLSFSGSTQTKGQVLNVISGVMSVQSTDMEGTIKELFGANDYVYLTFTNYNSSSFFNISDSELFSITYMNGTELNYTQVANWSVVNSSNTVNEWAWNVTSQRLKIDAPKTGGMYSITLFGNNKTFGTTSRFIINPFEICSSAKDTPGSVTSGNYYTKQFKKTDSIYFEIKILQASNPTGRATALNNSAGNSSAGGLGSACTVDTTTKQAVTNATLLVLAVRNTESGVLQNINTTSSVCQASDSSGTYSCTIQPLTKWDGGLNSVSFSIAGTDGTSGVATSQFEARSFYIYGYASTWQNNPGSNITLNVQIYEAGGNWWGGGGTGGLGGTVTVKKIEYMGRDGEWVWPPVSSDYNASALNSSTITSGSGTISLPSSFNTDGSWKSGNYRVVMQATTTSGDSDYGYAWFGVKLFDVYGMPIECTTFGCSYKSYFNSKENISLYVKVSKAGDYNYNAQRGQSIGVGNMSNNISISVKKIQDCRSWPCKELNSSDYTATSIRVNESSPWYWSASLNQSNYIIWINSTKGSWNTGYYSVVLDINGSDTGSAWFNTIAFYTETQPVDRNGSTYKYSIRGNQPAYFNITSVKSYKSGYYFSNNLIRYNTTDYVNTTVTAATLRLWDQTAQKQLEYSYPTSLSIPTLGVNGSGLLNISFSNGTWPSGYYWGEVTLKNAQSETSNSWLWFNVQPFRVQMSSSTYSLDTDQCINATINVYDPDWSSSSLLRGHNYSIASVSETSYNGGSNSVISYTNFTNSTFNATIGAVFCPNSGSWGAGSWGGYHYLNVLVKNNVTEESNVGWLSFRTIPFQIAWGSVIGGTSKGSTANLTVPVNISRSTTGSSTTGNLTKIYQLRSDSTTQYSSVKQEYIFSVGNCWSNVSGQCNITGLQNVTIWPPSTGWKVGYNYLQADWAKTTDATSTLQDWSGIYFEGKDAYNGYFTSQDTNGNWKYYFNTTENMTIKLFARDSSYSGVALNISSIQYSSTSSNCYSETCRSYTTPSSSNWAVVSGDGRSTAAAGSVITIKAPSGGWTKGDYALKAVVSGSSGTATITGGSTKVKSFVVPNVTVISPLNNATYNATNLTFSITTSLSAQCSLSLANYQNAYSWYCGGWNSTSSNSSNSTVPTPQAKGACNTTLYSYNGTRYYNEYLGNNYRSTYNGTTSTWGSGTYLTTGSTSHTYTFNTTGWPTNQDYGMGIWCWDSENNFGSALAAFRYRT